MCFEHSILAESSVLGAILFHTLSYYQSEAKYGLQLSNDLMYRVSSKINSLFLPLMLSDFNFPKNRAVCVFCSVSKVQSVTKFDFLKLNILQVYFHIFGFFFWYLQIYGRMWQGNKISVSDSQTDWYCFTLHILNTFIQLL